MRSAAKYSPALHRADGADRKRRHFHRAARADVSRPFQNETDRPDAHQRRGFLVYDKTGSIFNPFHNETKVRYEGRLPCCRFPQRELREAPRDYPELESATFISSCRTLDPRIKKLPIKSPAGVDRIRTTRRRTSNAT